MDCGCAIEWHYGNHDYGEGTINYCPLHAAAGDLLEAAKAAKTMMPLLGISHARAIQLLDNAIAKATGP